MSTNQLIVNPLEDPSPLARRVLVGPDTKIYRADIGAPKEEIKPENIVDGDSISVLAADDITYADSFTAVEITVTAAPEAAAVPEE